MSFDFDAKLRKNRHRIIILLILFEYFNRFVPKIARFFIFGHCGEEILAVAKKCKHCGAWLDDQNETAANVGPRHGGKPGGEDTNRMKFSGKTVGVDDEMSYLCSHDS